MTKPKIAVLNLGFRLFFLGAGIFSIISILLWMSIYVFQFPLQITKISYLQWHAHEMLYGFTMAVIAGFLLTAVKNWTGIQTLHGLNLLGLFTLWLLARVLFLFGTHFIFIAAVFDILFMLFLTSSIAYPIIKVRQWKQTGIMAKLVLLAVANGFFYFGVADIIEQGVYWSIYAGLFIIIGLILTIGRRVIPFFIEAGVGYPVKVFNSKWIDASSLLLYLALFIVEIFIRNRQLSSFIAMGLFIVTSIRLIGWHTPGIWKKPLLWSLFISFIFIDLGFLLIALSAFINSLDMLSVHSFSFGGIGLATLSMMARVSLGHTGRNVQSPPRAMTFSFLALIIGSIVRVIFPLIDANHYLIWIALSQVLWITAFLIFVITSLPILVRPRIDGQFG
ncbi:MAG TPA: NnrS family protein [Candidatus Competibacteraceae bacterium]|nr:NnrS family protein [Candidatus Competibacteraceae bacterium]